MGFWEKYEVRGVGAGESVETADCSGKDGVKALVGFEVPGSVTTVVE